MKKTVLFLITICVTVMVRAQLPAFPGAEGHGRYTTGGRGGKVYFVTNLTDVNSGNAATREGSLRWCLNQSGPRTVVFRVAGTLWLTAPLSITKGDVTIAGQSAPGDGVCIAGHPVSVSSDNVVIRFLRFRMGQERITSADGADVMGSRRFKNIIIDHCSFSWSTDECVSLYEGENITLQWSIIAESLRLSKHSKGPHGYGGIWGGKKASFHHNLMAHNDSRTPRFGPGTATQGQEVVDMRNCVIYNWAGVGCYGAEAMNINIVNNYYKPGPATASGTNRSRIIAIDKKTGLPSTDSFYPINNKFGKFFIEGNVVDASTSTSSSDKTQCNNATSDNWTYGVYNQINSAYSITASEKAALKVSTPFEAGEITTHTADVAFGKVLDYAGASLKRDSHDARIVNETRTGTAAYKGLSPYNGLGTVTYPAGTVIGNETLTTATTINWKSTSYPKKGIIDSETDIKPADAPAGWSPWPILAEGTAPADSNADGIPDGWLETNFPGKTAGDTDGAGYTLLEVYLNSLVSDLIHYQNSDAIVSEVDTPAGTANQIQLKQTAGEMVLESQVPMQEVKVLDSAGRLVRIDFPQSTRFTMVSVFPVGAYLLQVMLNGNQVPVMLKFLI